ncbi:DUF4012 domain-containing protein [Jatrophihabitans sp. YIM 134969]
MSARHVSELPARRSALRLWFRARRRQRLVHSRHRRLLRRYGPTWWTLVASATLFIGVVGYLTVTAVMVRSQITQLQSSLSTMQQFVREGKFADAQRAAADAAPAAARAHSLTDGPVWGLAAGVPWVGAPLSSVRETTAAVDQLTGSVLPSLTQVAGKLDPAVLRPDGRTVDVATLRRIAPTLHSASLQTNGIEQQVLSAPGHTWLPLVDNAHATVSAAVSKFAGLLRGADQAASIAPGLLGADGPRKYFVGFQNEAEVRGSGGLPGAFAILAADHGHVTFERFESDVALLSYRPDGMVKTGLDFGPDYDAQWKGSDPTSLYVNSNLSAHFPYAARIWVAMWEKVSGEHLDGAMAIDPTALSYLLAVTGPAQVADGTVVTAENVVDLTQRVAYAKYPDTVAGGLARKEWLKSVTAASERQLLSGRGDAAALVAALARGVGERRVLAWSSDADVQQALARTPAAGIVPDDAAPFTGIVINNAAAGKLDYYVDRRFDYLRTGCGSTRDVMATLTLTNNAPASGLPPIVTRRLDSDAAKAQKGDTRMLVDYVATDGAVLKSLTVDGRPVAAARYTERGHPVYRIDLELPRGTTVEIVVHVTEPAGGGGRPTLLLPPGIRPVPVTVNDQSCS